MACNCREEIEKVAREEFGDPLAKLRGVIAFQESSLQFKPSIEIIYRKKKKDGSFSKTVTSMELVYEYCPFCGKKFNEDKEVMAK